MSPASTRTLWLSLAAFSIAGVTGCQRAQGGSTAATPVQAGVAPEVVTRVPLGDVAGAAQTSPAYINPYADQPQAIAEGKELFVRMNCAGCHGYEAKGGMGPNLTDTYWRYGGVPALIYKSIYEGRPQGMPAWNPALPSDDIWKLVAYIQSLGGTFPPEGFQASLQGDRAGELVAPEVTNVLPPKSASMPAASASANLNTSPGAARPDAGGKP